MKISIIGSGIVGQQIGKVFAKTKEVVFHDVSKETLEELKKEGYKTDENLESAVLNTDISFIALPTPLDKTDHFDYSILKIVAENLSKIIGKKCDIGEQTKQEFQQTKCEQKLMRKNDISELTEQKLQKEPSSQKENFHVFVLKSTVTPGTTRNILIKGLEKNGKKAGKDFGVVYNPEFLSFIQDTWTKDSKFEITPEKEGRIILGVNNMGEADVTSAEQKEDRAGKIVEDFYKTIYSSPIFKTNYETAEYKKLFANSRLALVVSYANENLLVANQLKGKYDIDINFIVEKTALDPRIGKYGSVFGKAYGGPCFLKDLPAFVSWVKDELGVDLKLVRDTVLINNIMKEKFGIRE